MDDEITDQDLPEARKFPRLLADDATHEDIIRAINGIAVEWQLAREAIQELGTRMEAGFKRLEKAFAARECRR